MSRLGRGSRGFNKMGAATVINPHPALASSWFGGINLVGSTATSTYVYPSTAQIDYYTSTKGMRIARVVFFWSDLQPTLNGALDSSYLLEIIRVVKRLRRNGAIAIIDCHSNGYHGTDLIGAGTVTSAHFVNLWTRLAANFINTDNVWFGLMNEPYDNTATESRDYQLAAVTGIRGLGANNICLLNFRRFSAALNFFFYGNDTVWDGQVPTGCYFDSHNYLDSARSGDPVSNAVEVGVATYDMHDFTVWCRARGYKAFCGEINWINDAGYNAEATERMVYFDQNRDVWIGFGYWLSTQQAAGQGTFKLDQNNGADMPQWSQIDGHLTDTAPTYSATLDSASKSSNLTLSNGNLTATKTVAGSAYSGAISSFGKTSGKWAVLCKPQVIGDLGNCCIGLAGSDFANNNFLGANTKSMGFFFAGGANIYYNGSPLATNCDSISSPGSQWYWLLFDIDAALAWTKRWTAADPSRNWNNNASANPATGVGGASFASLKAAVAGGVIYVGTNLLQQNDQIDMIFNSHDFPQSPPLGGFRIWRP